MYVFDLAFFCCNILDVVHVFCLFYAHTNLRAFFDMCDGIFLNYNWSVSDLSSSRALAGERRGEVYVGVDVFGRGCYGGGGFNSCKVKNCTYSMYITNCTDKFKFGNFKLFVY